MARQVWQLKDFRDNTNTVVIGEMVLISYDRGFVVPGGETLAETLVIGNVTGGTNIEVTNTDNIYFPDVIRTLFTFDSGYSVTKVAGVFNWNVQVFAVSSTGGLTIFQASSDGVVRVGGTGLNSRFQLFNTGGFNTEHDVTEITANRTFKYPDANVDFTGGATGQVLTQQSNGDFIPAWQQSNALTSVSANYTALATDSTINCTANTFTVTLPTAIGFTGRLYIVKNSGSGTITVNTTLSQTMDGQLTQTLSQYDSLSIQSDGANWIII